MKGIPAWLLMFIFTLSAHIAEAQSDFEAYKQQEQAKYDQYRQNENKQFERYKDSLNQAYKQYRDSCAQALKNFRDSLNPEFGRGLKQKWQKNKTLPPNQPDGFQSSNHSAGKSSFTPPTQPAGNKTFYGKALQFNFPKQTGFKLKTLTEEEVGDAWLHLNQCNLNDLIIDCQLITKDMHLNDWGFYQMVCWCADQIFPETAHNEKVIFHFFMLTQSGYKCKIGYDENKQLTLLLPFNTLIFYRNYQEYNGISYYIIEKKSANSTISTYPLEFLETSRIMDVNLRQTPRFGNDNTIYKEFKWPQVNFRIKLPINQYLIRFYNTYPTCQLNIYNQTKPSVQLVESVRSQFAPLLNTPDTTEKITRILHFMHAAFQYKPDEEYWKQERYFFPEESLFYPYMDCEDYAILFCYLTQILTNTPAILVAYPKHVAAAVKMRQNITKGYILYKNQKYTLCDPSYKGSNPGEVIPAVSKMHYRIL